MTTTTTPPIDTFNATRAGIEELKARADEALKAELHAISEAASRDDAEAVNVRLRRRNILEELVSNAAWLATSLTDVLAKVADGAEPYPVMASDLGRRIREAEIRLELLREMSRK